MVGTPSEKEEEYIKRQELEKIKKLREQCAKDTAEQEKNDLKEQHWMHCPKCGMQLHTILINKVEVDKCFSCNGIFLDDGELEKISGRGSTFFEEMNDVFKD